MIVIYQVGHLARLPLGTPYPGIVAHVGRLLGQLPGAELAIDLTGVGRPVGDLFRYSGISPVGVQITGGTATTYEGNVANVPKIVLVSRVQALLHEGRLRILKSLPEAATLARELADFRVQYTAVGNMTFNARVGRHDDLLLALAIAIWRGDGGGMPHSGVWEYARMRATGVRTSMYIGLDLGQSKDPTAIAVVRRVVDPEPRDFVEMPVAARARVTFAKGSAAYEAGLRRLGDGTSTDTRTASVE